MRTIPQRELRNSIGRVLREVEAGEVLRITVDGRPVADLVPIGDGARAFVPRAGIQTILKSASLDPGFAADLENALDQTVEAGT